MSTVPGRFFFNYCRHRYGSLRPTFQKVPALFEGHSGKFVHYAPTISVPPTYSKYCYNNSIISINMTHLRRYSINGDNNDMMKIDISNYNNTIHIASDNDKDVDLLMIKIRNDKKKINYIIRKRLSNVVTKLINIIITDRKTSITGNRKCLIKMLEIA